jgi:hypothetical protein
MVNVGAFGMGIGMLLGLAFFGTIVWILIEEFRKEEKETKS